MSKKDDKIILALIALPFVLGYYLIKGIVSLFTKTDGWGAPAIYEEGEIYEAEASLPELGKHRIFTGRNEYDVRDRAAAQQEKWNEMWRKECERKRKASEREERAILKEKRKEEAQEITIKAERAIGEIENILSHTLSVNDAIDWELLLSREQFTQEKPVKRHVPMPLESEYAPEKEGLDWIFRKKRERKEQEAKRQFEKALQDWQAAKKRAELDYAKELEKWQRAKEEFHQRQASNDEAVLERKEAYLQKDKKAVVNYCEMVLENSQYPDYFPKQWDMEYKDEAKILILNYILPDIEALPKEKSARYIATTDTIKVDYLSDSVFNKLYDRMLYEAALRTIHELFEADVADALDSVVFNGWVNSIDKATGQDVNACIMSVQTSKEEFMKIKLARIDPKTCFKSFKGIAANTLHSLAAVAPVIAIDKEDRRFVASRDVVSEVDHSTNLAAMDWQDFENLIRELFEKEFAVSGGEVKVTQASRDGGVDAIAFDPDPIRGGKIVIQAKRYTNTVGVAAVRELYGTVTNEGAMKGILVTTADYGADAYEFVKDKPLTLLNGNNLLHMLEKHGHKAKIDIKEAKAILASD